MIVSMEEIRHLAELSNLSMADEELKAIGADLNNIVSYISQLDELNTDGVQATYQCIDLQNVWREDEVVDFEAGREELLDLAAKSLDEQIKVPKVL